MQKSYENMFADNRVLKDWALDLYNNIGGMTAERSLVYKQQDMDKVKYLCYLFVEQWNVKMQEAIEEYKKKEEE